MKLKESEFRSILSGYIDRTSNYIKSRPDLDIPPRSFDVIFDGVEELIKNQKRLFRLEYFFFYSIFITDFTETTKK